MTTISLADQLTTLGLRATATGLDDLVARATKHRWSPTQLLEHLAAAEQEDRARRGLERRLARARLGRFKPMADFDWAWPTRLDRDAVEAAPRPDFLAEARNLLLIRHQGLRQPQTA